MRRRAGTERQRDRRKKKAPAGPAKRAAKKLPKRRAMIAAPRKRAGSPNKGPDGPIRKISWRVDRLANRGLEAAYPPLHALFAWVLLQWRRFIRLAAPPLRAAAALLFHLLARGERLLRRLAGAAARAATAASRVVTPQRAIGATIVAVGVCLIASQFVDYRGVQIGQSSYAGLPDVAAAPTVDVRTAGEAHSYLLIPLGLVAAALGALGMVRDRRRLGLLVAALGLVALAVILLVDLSAGLDVGSQSSRFAGASAVLKKGFWAELAAAAGLVLSGLLYYARPCRIRINSSGRAASARRRRPRRRASSQAKAARSA
jgi:hypothetical protein